MPAFDRLNPNFVRLFLMRIKNPTQFASERIVESDGVFSVLKSTSAEAFAIDDIFHKNRDSPYGFEFAPIPLRFGTSFTSDIAHEVKKLNAHNPVIVTDPKVIHTHAFKKTKKALEQNVKISFDIFDKATCEPTDSSLKYAIEYARNKKYDCFIAIGGGSVMDTARIMSLFASNPMYDITEIMTDEPSIRSLYENSSLPIISIPTTFSLGSESAGGLSYMIEGKDKFGSISTDSIKPRLIIADPLNVVSVPKHVAINGVFDLLIHALETYTNKEFIPHISNVPAVTGSELQSVFRVTNQISDAWSVETLRLMNKFLRPAVLDPNNHEAKALIFLASTFSGMGFRNPAARLCHTLAQPIRLLGKHYSDSEYDKQKHMVPHGLAVAIAAPVAFMFSAYASPGRHLEAARLLGAHLYPTSTPRDIGHVLADALRKYMEEFEMPNGLSALGFKFEETFKLAELCVQNFKPSLTSSPEMDKEILHELYESMWKIY